MSDFATILPSAPDAPAKQARTAAARLAAIGRRLGADDHEIRDVLDAMGLSGGAA